MFISHWKYGFLWAPFKVIFYKENFKFCNLNSICVSSFGVNSKFTDGNIKLKQLQKDSNIKTASDINYISLLNLIHFNFIKYFWHMIYVSNLSSDLKKKKNVNFLQVMTL